MRTLVVGTRSSQLARTQTNWVIDALRASGIKNEIEVKEFVTKGDRNHNVSLAEVGGSGIFIQELQQAIIDEEIDFAVHSMKDLDPVLPTGLVIGAVPEREDHRDALVAREGRTLEELQKGALVGTSSLRRAAQIRSVRPDVKTKWIRGSVEARIEQLEDGDFDAIILAVAGLKRLHLQDGHISEYLREDQFVPAVGQGALAIECRANDTELQRILAVINDQEAFLATQTERRFEEIFAGENSAPVGAYAHMRDHEIILHATIISDDGMRVLISTAQGTDPDTVAHAAKDDLMKQGAQSILDAFDQKGNES